MLSGDAMFIAHVRGRRTPAGALFLCGDKTEIACCQEERRMGGSIWTDIQRGAETYVTVRRG